MITVFLIAAATVFAVLAALNFQLYRRAKRLLDREAEYLPDDWDLPNRVRENAVFCLVFMAAMAWFAYASWSKI